MCCKSRHSSTCRSLKTKRKTGTYPAADRRRRSKRALGRHHSRHRRRYRQHTKRRKKMLGTRTGCRRNKRRNMEDRHQCSMRWRSGRRQDHRAADRTVAPGHQPGLRKCCHRTQQHLRHTNRTMPTHTYLQGHNTSHCTMTRIPRYSIRQRSTGSYRHTYLQVRL